MPQGKLFLIPNTLGESDVRTVLPATIAEVLDSIGEFIVEDERTARRFLKKAGYTGSLDTVILHLLNEHTDQKTTASFLDGINDGKNIGIISDAGCPAVADPGAIIVKMAHEKNIDVVPITGPSSIIMALMASGMNGQNFAFNGYLPKEKSERTKKIKELEQLAVAKKQTQLFIETPYRNIQLFEELITQCAPSTRLCIACDITLASEYIRTKNIADWKKEKPDINKRPAVFVLGK
jgi:16S rRNA (cytidine1402-2'-O)-methyltransferase